MGKGRGIEDKKTGIKPAFFYFVRVGRIELPSRPWQGRILPLNHTRKFSDYNKESIKFNNLTVGTEGLEPSRITPYASETYAYTRFRHVPLKTIGEL